MSDDINATDATNVTSLFSVVSNNGQLAEERNRVHTYVIETIEGREYVNSGFLIFTAQHVAVMRELDDNNSIPILVLPLGQVKVVELIENGFDEDDDLDEEDYETRI